VKPELRRRLDARLRTGYSAGVRTLALATAAVVVLLVGIAASVIAGDPLSRPAKPHRSATHETPTFSSLPVPSDVHVTTPVRTLPRELAAFSGIWQGIANGNLPIRFIIEEIDARSARVVFVWGNAHDGSLSAGWQRYNADVLPGARIAWGRGTSSAGRDGGCDAHGDACSALRFVLTMGADRQTILASRDVVGYPPVTVTLRRPGFHTTMNFVIGLASLAIVVFAALMILVVPAARRGHD
jgi:hypothetical protein